MIDKSKLMYSEWRVIRNALIGHRSSLRIQAQDLRSRGFDSSPEELEGQADVATQLLRVLADEFGW